MNEHCCYCGKPVVASHNTLVGYERDSRGNSVALYAHPACSDPDEEDKPVIVDLIHPEGAHLDDLPNM